MAEVKWIKITTDIFDDEKILLIESLPDADSIIVIWFKLLCLAGKTNNSGVFMMNDSIPYTDKMLATIFRRKESTVKLAISTFEKFGMVKIIDDVITIPNWGKHQNLDQLENKREYMQGYMQDYRRKQKELACKANCKTNSKVYGKTNGKTNSKTNVSALDKEEEKEGEKEGEREYNKGVQKKVADLYNEICISFPRLVVLSDARMKAINARLKKFTLDDFKTLFEKAEASDFLKGGNARNWSATFDWLIKDANMAKVLDGNYDNKFGPGLQRPKNRVADELEESYAMIARWAAEGGGGDDTGTL
jgi:predicted phage replisome organizer